MLHIMACEKSFLSPASFNNQSLIFFSVLHSLSNMFSSDDLSVAAPKTPGEVTKYFYLLYRY